MSDSHLERQLISTIVADPSLEEPWLIYADWLDERGDNRADELRGKFGRGLNIADMPFVWCPPGEFLMGSPEDESHRYYGEDQVEVRLTRGFWLGRYTITQDLWQTLMNTTPWQGEWLASSEPNCPASYISWYDACEYCRELTKQTHAAGELPHTWKFTLPTEAQWEYACRAGTTTTYSFGKGASQLLKYAWLGGSNPWPIGQKAPNPWGFYDMHGNINEWCLNCYTNDHPGGADPVVPEDRGERTMRGGSFFQDFDDCRSARRRSERPERGGYYIGFRVAVVQSTVGSHS